MAVVHPLLQHSDPNAEGLNPPARGPFVGPSGARGANPLIIPDPVPLRSRSSSVRSTPVSPISAVEDAVPSTGASLRAERRMLLAGVQLCVCVFLLLLVSSAPNIVAVLMTLLRELRACLRT